MNISELLPLLSGARKTGSLSYLARCPAHNDKTPSLRISQAQEGNILLHCFAGCSIDDITGALGLTKADLFANSAERPGTQPDPERAAKHQQAAREQAERIAKNHWRTAQKAQVLWKNAKPATYHPYLEKKSIKPHCARVSDWRRMIKNEREEWSEIIIKNALLVPMFDETGALFNLQAIFESEKNPLERAKDFLSFGRTKGLYCTLGEEWTFKLCVAEGYATGSTIFENTGYQTFISFSAGNLKAVSKIIRSNRPDAEIIVCGDNDASGTGQRAAIEAAQEIDGFFIHPPKLGDFNDYAAEVMQCTAQ